MSNTLKDKIVDIINNLAQPNTIFVLKGFSRYLADIKQDFLFNQETLFSEKASLNQDIIKLLLATEECRFITHESLIALSDQQMIGTLLAVGKL